MRKIQTLKVFSVIGAFLVGFWVPLRLIGYLTDSSVEIMFDLLISLVAGANIYLYFSTTKRSIKDYRSWLNLGLLCDVICLMPLSLFGLLLFNTTYSGLLLFNLLAARHVKHIKSFLDQFDNLQPIVYRLVPIFVMLPILIHLAACAWIGLGSGSAGPDPDKLFEYVKAMYWAFTTLTTVGYGDISAKTMSQMIFTCGVQVIGVGLFGFILSNVAGLLARQDAAREHHMDNLDKIETYMVSHHIPNEMRTKVRSYYHYMWQNKKGYQDHSIIEDLPKKIQSELIFHINKPILEKVPFLKGASRELVEELMNELETRVYVPGERVFKAGDVGDAMYFIHKGQVDILTKDDKLIATLGEGFFFGEMALIFEGPRTAGVVAKQFCDLYVLKKESFAHVCDKYPEFLDHIHKVVQQRAG
ncbi:cyclic nucleotide-gated ion channel [Bdellovibrio reynosensis]|uniref:Cyclic nucleotide-binding domain-containing protein n=1 Tax=Bdellovibrio reynosensis TaxID=2835041 RepID=A0ABY4C6Q5_9BACT|nr:cyclic nucleotide-gated ion channel [Bdellovibrio reynosensis]UOF00484.1 cyclic nucleotide-binding domain-containing protein [Bdellovibrio reynosensis]